MSDELLEDLDDKKEEDLEEEEGAYQQRRVEDESTGKYRCWLHISSFNVDCGYCLDKNAPLCKLHNSGIFCGSRCIYRYGARIA